MARKAKKANPWPIIGIVAAVFGGVALLSKGQSAASIEAEIDEVIGVLNATFGKRWVNVGLDVLKKGLETLIPRPLLLLVDLIYEVEHAGLQHGLSGADKRQHVMDMHTRRRGR